MLFPVWAYAQELSYMHYDTKDGLAGSTVYDLCQDKEGFIWFATENGLSRFDGTNFRNFTVKDGLPDNEVLKLHADKKGRVWIGSFSKEVCYYFKNKIYTKETDTVLKNIRFKNNIVMITEDQSGNIMLGDHKALIELSLGNKINYITERPFFVKEKSEFFSAFPDYFSGGFFIHTDKKIFKQSPSGAYELFYLIPKTISDRLMPYKFFRDGRSYFIRTPVSWTSSENPLDNSYTSLFINTLDGSWSVDTLNNTLKEHFLPGKKISHSLIDLEGNTWFSTLGEGVFKMSSRNIRSFKFSELSDTDHEIFSLAKEGNTILGGMTLSKLIKVSHDSILSLEDYNYRDKIGQRLSTYNRLYTMETLSGGEVILGFDNFLLKKKGKEVLFNSLPRIKSICQIDDKNILVGNADYVVKVRINDLVITDTIWKGRSTKVFYHDNHYYIATMHGLISIDPKGNQKFLGDIHPAFLRRVNDIKLTTDGTLLIATNDAGIIGMSNGKVNYILNDKKGLSSNICKSLFYANNTLWIATNKGINKVNLSDLSVISFSTSEGLPTNIVNDVLVSDSTVWLGTPEGLVYFNENSLTGESISRLVILDIKIAGKSQPLRSDYKMDYNKRDLIIDYAGISFKSSGEMNYIYKLAGLDNEWRQTSNTTLAYQSLPPGNYKLFLYALNKYGVKSKIKTLNIVVASPFWRTWWFYLIIAALFIGFTWWFINMRVRKNNMILRNKNMFERQVAAVEQQALQAQMNPHFIFNCLNSIQQYIFTKDTGKANKYLTEFASLIRLTLELSGKRTILVSEEIDYINRYLKMETMRFGDNFSYSINVGEGVNVNNMEIPAMLLQPYIENSLRHGIRYKRNQKGQVDILFYIESKKLCCSVTDNGIGRVQAAEFKSKQHIEYQSRGMELTEKRIGLLNKILNDPITVKVEDLYFKDGSAAGTKVVITFPLA